MSQNDSLESNLTPKLQTGSSFKVHAVQSLQCNLQGNVLWRMYY